MNSQIIEAIVEGQFPAGHSEQDRDPLRRELEALSQKELHTLWNERMSDEKSAKTLSNRRRVFADLELWLRIDAWYLNEAQLLSVGYCPRNFNRDAFVFSDDPERWSRLDAITLASNRAVEAGVLKDPVAPEQFLGWAKAKQFVVHPPLVRAIERSLRQHADPALNETEAGQDVPAAARAHIEECQNKIAELENELARMREMDRDLGPKERRSLYVILLGIVMEKYHYKVGAERNGAGPKIAGQLAARGVKIDQDTVTNWLKKAAQAVGSEFQA